MHSKINHYLPKGRITPLLFLNAMKNILMSSEIKLSKIIRKDFISQTLSDIALKINKKDFKWISYNKFKEIQKKIVADNTSINYNYLLYNKKSYYLFLS